MSEDPAAAEREKEMRLFYLRHRDRVRKFVSWRVRDQNDMEDVCQETWRAFFTRFDEYVANYERPTTALFTIARRRVTDFWRQLGRLWEEPIEGENLSLLADAVSARTRPTDAVDSEIDLERALNALPTRQREALHLHHVDGLTVAETATVMGISPNTLKKLLTGRWRQPQAPEQAGDRRAEAAGRFRGVGPRRLRRGARPVGAGRSGESPDVHVCIGVDDPNVSRQQGILEYLDSRWHLSNTGKRPIRIAQRLLFPGEDPLSLGTGYTTIFVETPERQHLLEVFVTGPSGQRPVQRYEEPTQPPRTWHLTPDEKLVLIVLSRRYLRHEPDPQPVSWRSVADMLADLQPEAEWTAKRAQHLVLKVRERLSRAGVRGLTISEVSPPVGNVLNHNLIQELLMSTTLVPMDLALIGSA